MNTEDDEFARIEREQALDKMAENARELGLDYKPAQQEPVAYMDICEKNQMSGLRYWSEPDNRHEVALYTSPPAQRKPLTGQQIRALWEQEAKPERSTAHFFTAFTRAIEAAHNIKENT